jgi:hypothetical protein
MHKGMDEQTERTRALSHHIQYKFTLLSYQTAMHFMKYVSILPRLQPQNQALILN